MLNPNTVYPGTRKLRTVGKVPASNVAVAKGFGEFAMAVLNVMEPGDGLRAAENVPVIVRLRLDRVFVGHGIPGTFWEVGTSSHAVTERVKVLSGRSVRTASSSEEFRVDPHVPEREYCVPGMFGDFRWVSL